MASSGRQNRLLIMTTKLKKQAAVKTTKKNSVSKVALLGFGTVGSSVAKVLALSKFPGVQLTHVYNRAVDRKRSSPNAKYVPAAAIWTEDIEVVLKSDADI